MEAPFDAYIGYNGKDGVVIEKDDGKKAELLWGDGVFFVDATVNSGKRKVRARGMTGWVATKHLSGQPLLELYFIDVGQGDGVLIRTPDFRHILIDAGFPRKRQPTNKSGADFVDWKFHKDYSRDNKRNKVIRLDALIASHNDYDHYGGLIDLLDVEQQTDLDCIAVTIEQFFHAGLSWWKGNGGKRTLGDEAQDDEGGTSYTELLQDRDSALVALDGSDASPTAGHLGQLHQEGHRDRHCRRKPDRLHPPEPLDRRPPRLRGRRGQDRSAGTGRAQLQWAVGAAQARRRDQRQN